MFAPASLKARLALVIGAVAVLSALVSSQFASQLSRHQIEDAQSTLLLQISSRMTAQLAHDMNTRANEILFLTQYDRIRNPAFPVEGKREILERVRKAYPFYAWIGITDIDGNIIVGTDELLVGKNVKAREWFSHGKTGLYFGDAHDAFLLAKLLPKPRWDDLPLRLVDVSAPIHDEKGRFIGVICGHLSLDWAFEARESMLDQVPGERLDLLVLNKDGKVLMGTLQLPSLKVDLSSQPSIRALADQPRSVTVETWPDGKRYLTAAQRETGFRDYPGMGWSVVARRSAEVAFAPADRLSRWILLGGIGATLLFVGLVWVLLNKHLGPLTAIADAARRMRDGEATQIPQPKGDGELAVFARSLIDLANSLQEKNDELRLASRVFEESGQGILISDAQNRVLRVNRAFTKITGYAPEEMIGKTPAALQSGYHDAAFYQTMWAAIQQNGTWQGEIWNRTREGRTYPEWLTINTLRDESGAITNFIAIFDDITEKKAYEKRLVHLANYDSLTDLPNRNLMQIEVAAMLQRSKAEESTLALMFVDLDKFKHINDTLGHPAGDLVLKEVAARFSSQMGAPCLLSRWGGDEFVVAMPGFGVEAADQLARRLVETLQRPFAIEGGRYHISMSVGIAMYPSDGTSVDHLLRCADTAMYRAKRDGVNQIRFYESAMNAGVERFLKVDNALRQALFHGGEGLQLLYQPQYSPDGKTILSAEALIRWQHPELGAVSPGQFIPVAEDSGQIIQLGRWIIEEAVKGSAALARMAGKEISISINCSAHQLRDSTLVQTLQRAAGAAGVSPASLMIEVTESAIMSDEHKAMETLVALKALGYRISVDDFGTGYSCLNYIQKIHPAEIKVDQGFVRNMLIDQDSLNIIKFTMGLADSMGMEIVAEGVETEEQRQTLQALGPIKMQGFLLSRPIPVTTLGELLARQRG